ncbi:LysM peptidoglycan-binding domain-containing protein [Kytococcus sp. Marseille-QA3725]
MEWTDTAPQRVAGVRPVVARVLVALVATGCCLAAWVVGHDAVAGATAAWHAPDPVEPLGWLVRAGLAVVVAWLAGVFTLEALAGLPGWVGRSVGEVRDRLGPWGGGALVSLCLGVLGAPAAAHADGPQDPLDLTSLTAPASASAPAAEARPAEPSTSREGAESPGTESTTADEAVAVVVQEGDTLWDITARHLGPGASAADVAREWPRWHEANRERLGDDPDLLLPGTRLIVPTEPAAGAR